MQVSKFLVIQPVSQPIRLNPAKSRIIVVQAYMMLECDD